MKDLHMQKSTANAGLVFFLGLPPSCLLLDVLFRVLCLNFSFFIFFFLLFVFFFLLFVVCYLFLSYAFQSAILNSMGDVYE